MKRVKSGKEICEYVGREVQGTNIAEDSDWKAYIIGNHDESIQICALDENGVLTCLAGLINDCLSEEGWNVEFQWRGRRCFVVALRDIEEGEELFGPYSGPYWRSGRYPLELTLRARECYELVHNRENVQAWDAVIHYLETVSLDLTFEDDQDIQVIHQVQQHEVIDLSNEE